MTILYNPGGNYGGEFTPSYDQYRRPELWRPQALRPAAGYTGGSAGGYLAVSKAKSSYGSGRMAAPLGPSSWTTTSPGGHWYAQKYANDSNYNALQAQNQAKAQAELYNMTPKHLRPAMGGGGGYGGGGSLADSYQSAFDEAKAENERRYLEGISGYQSRLERNLGYLDSAGQQEAEDINEIYDNQGSKISQDLISRGLSASTIRPVMEMGNNRERVKDLGRLKERLLQQRVNVDSNLSGDQLRYMEARSDTYPDYNQLAALSRGLGEAGYNHPINTAPVFASPGELGYSLPNFSTGGGLGSLPMVQQTGYQRRGRDGLTGMERRYKFARGGA
jgi:hypothetical protein